MTQPATTIQPRRRDVRLANGLGYEAMYDGTLLCKPSNNFVPAKLRQTSWVVAGDCLESPPRSQTAAYTNLSSPRTWCPCIGYLQDIDIWTQVGADTAIQVQEGMTSRGNSRPGEVGVMQDRGATIEHAQVIPVRSGMVWGGGRRQGTIDDKAGRAWCTLPSRYDATQCDAIAARYPTNQWHLSSEPSLGKYNELVFGPFAALEKKRSASDLDWLCLTRLVPNVSCHLEPCRPIGDFDFRTRRVKSAEDTKKTSRNATPPAPSRLPICR